MFDNMGGKIKTLAKVLVFLGILASVIGAIVLWAQAGQVSSRTGSYYYSAQSGESTTLVITGFVVLVVGVLASWVSSFVLYGFGQLVENSDIIAQSMTAGPTHLTSGGGQGKTESTRVHPLLGNSASSNKSATRICPDCGAKVDSTLSFCPRCTADLSAKKSKQA